MYKPQSGLASAQVSILPVFSDAVLHTAAFLSQNLPPILDTIVPPTYVRQVWATLTSLPTIKRLTCIQRQCHCAL